MSAAYYSFKGISIGQEAAWATLAAALALVTSMVSAWGAQRIVELEEARMSPYPYPQFDTKSRYGLLLLKMSNLGGGAAHNIRLIWDKPLKSSDGKLIDFANSENYKGISVLLPNQHISKIVDGTTAFFSSSGPHIYSGTVEFNNGRGNRCSHKFQLDAECLMGTPMNDEESQKTHYELQKLPNEIEKLRKSIDAIVKKI